MTEAETQLLQEAKSILHNNWMSLEDGSGFSIPAEGVYPYQWNWDAGFAALGYTHFDVDRAIVELDSLFAGQWKNGMLPHIVFHTESSGYFPNQSFWEVNKRSEDAPEHVQTSGMTQPPIHAIAVWRIYETLKKTDPDHGQRWLLKMYPKLHQLHAYFYRERDQDNTGLITIYHPWESGLDNSPRWDQPLAAVEMESVPTYQRLDTNFIDERFRPSDASYDKYVYLAEKMRSVNYDEAALRANHPFQVEDILLSSILHLATNYLRKMAVELGADTEQIDEWQHRFAESVTSRCWDDEDNLFYDYDVISKQLIKVKTVASIAPIISGSTNDDLTLELFDTLDDSNFCGSNSCRNSLLPSTGMQESFFNPNQYWRGPVWININWLLWLGLKNGGHKKQARDMRNNILNCLQNNGIWEYYSPEDGNGIGAHKFTWSAALAIDILQAKTDNPSQIT